MTNDIKAIPLLLVSCFVSLSILSTLTDRATVAFPENAIAPNQSQQTKVQSLTGVAADVDRVARQITVRVDSKQHGNGSGTIVAKNGNIYYVLTAKHVISQPDEYEIVTPDGQRYRIDPATIKQFEGADIALVQFSSSQSYQVATLGNYQTKALENRLAFLSGFPGVKQNANGEPTRQFTGGKEVEQSFIPLEVKESTSLINGYELVYSSLSLPGMSGAPVLDSLGRVIGINAAAEAELEVDNAGQAVEIYLGYSLGVPIRTFLGQIGQTNLNPNLLKIETSAPTTSQSEVDAVLASLPVDPSPSQGASAFDWLNRGNYLWRLGQDSDAIASFDRAIQLKPDFYQAYYALGTVLRGQKSQEALAAYDKATQIQPNFYQAWRERASLLYGMNKTTEAIASIDKAIELQPNDAFLYLQRGEILASEKRFSEAMVAYNKSIELQPSYLAYFKRGDTRFQLEDYQRAFDDANQAIAMQPENGLAYYTRGLAQNRLNNPQAAIADLSKSIELMPYLFPAYYARSAIFENLEQYDKALADLNKIIELAPGYAQAYFQRGSLRATRFNDYQGAIADFNKAIELDPNNGEAYMRRAYIRATQLGDVEGALADIAKAIEIDPENPRYYLNRAQLLVNLQNYQGAIADLSQAIQLQPDNADAYFQRAAARSNIQDFQGAKQDLQQAAQLYQAQGNSQQYEAVQNILRMMEK